MAIKGYNSVNSSNNVPFNNDPGQTINEGDMLYWSVPMQAFQVGPKIVTPTKLSELQNDRLFVTEYMLQTAIAEAELGGGSGSLDGYATTSYVQELFNNVNSGVTSYNDLTDKPTIPDRTSQLVNDRNYVTSTDLTTAIQAIPLFSGNYADLINKPSIFSGNYNDLVNRPIIPTDVSQLADSQNLLSGGVDLTPYALKTEIPTVPTSVSELTNDAGYITLANLPAPVSLDGYATESYVQTELANYQPTVDLTQYYTKTEVDGLIPTPFSGSYNDLTDTPTIPDISEFLTETEIDSKIASVVAGGTVDLSAYVTDTELQTTLSNYQPTIDLSNYYTRTEVDNLIPTTFSGDYNDLVNVPTLFTGSYNDLTDAPTIPDLTGYATESYVQTQLAGYQPSVDLSAYALKTELFDGDYNSLSNTPSIPSDISELTDSQGLLGQGGGSVDLTGYATESYVQQQISSATLEGVASINDLDDVAIGSLPQVDREDDYYLMEYNPISGMWESRNFGNVFATQAYVSATVATALTNGDVNLDGYATEQFVEQRLLELGEHFSGDYYELTNRPILFSGDYRDLTNKPADNSDLRLALSGNELRLINVEPEPDTVVSTVDLSTLADTLANSINYENLSGLPILFSGNYEDLTNRPQLFSGNYNDLRNKPYIPSIAGLATEEYVDNRWAEPTITGDRTFTGDIIFENFVQQKVSTVNATASKRDLVFAIQTTNDLETEVLLSDGSRVAIEQGTTAIFKATIVASSGDNRTAFTVRGVIDHNDAGINVIGTNIVETINDSGQDWTAALSADTINNSLKITVTGSLSTTIDWTVFLEISEVIR
jgi:hypothetical protein